MRRTLLCMSALLATSASAFGQAASSDTQTLQALLSEVRALRQELRAALNRTQSVQILLARFQVQEGVVAKASDRLNESRQKVFDTHVQQKELAVEAKRLEDALNGADTSQQQADLQERIKHAKSELEVAGNIAQQQQTAEIQAEQQLRDEQDRLAAIETQLDELIRIMGSPAETSGRQSALNPKDALTPLAITLIPR
jgi:DNA repair exonuclease SbcCD ATPase subunit